MDKDNESKHPGGRPKAVQWLEEEAVLFGKFRATEQTIADYYGCSLRTIERMFSDDDNEFCRVYKKSLADSKMTLHEAQFNNALSGNSTMLVWLGKQMLGQTDKQEIDHTSGGKPIQPKITFSK